MPCPISLLFDAAIVVPSLAVFAASSKHILPEESSATINVFWGGAVTIGALALAKVLKKKVVCKAHGPCHSKSEVKAPVVESGPALPTPEQTLSLIKKRRSVFPKDYTGENVPREALAQILEAANWAPTHNLTEAYRFAVIEGDEKKKFEELIYSIIDAKFPAEQAADARKKVASKTAHWSKVSAFVALGVKKQARPDKSNPEWEEICSVAAAAQNMALQGTALGLASYWSSFTFAEVARESDELKAYLGLLPEDRLLGFLVIGQSNRIEGYRGKRGNWAEKVVFKA